LFEKYALAVGERLEEEKLPNVDMIRCDPKLFTEDYLDLSFKEKMQKNRETEAKLKSYLCEIYGKKLPPILNLHDATRYDYDEDGTVPYCYLFPTAWNLKLRRSLEEFCKLYKESLKRPIVVLGIPAVETISYHTTYVEFKPVIFTRQKEFETRTVEEGVSLTKELIRHLKSLYRIAP
jgi:hypothetical protein